VLKSWAVPKGPSLDPGVNRLAVHVEDHSFEGRIPEGHCGAGTVLLSDRSLWIPEGDPLEAYRNGKLVFALEGRKLRGCWSLVRFKAAQDGGKENWLLRKLQDADARAGRRLEKLVRDPWRRPPQVRQRLPGSR
jgi:bifunctional non-homologous end joining protein LigD